MQATTSLILRSPAGASRRTHHVAAALFTTLLFTPTLAHACSCVRIAPEGFRQQADAIIEGRVIDVGHQAGTSSSVVARIAVDRRIKGETPEIVTVVTRPHTAACGVPFKAGQTGEFLLRQEQAGQGLRRFSTNTCLMLGARR